MLVEYLRGTAVEVLKRKDSFEKEHKAERVDANNDPKHPDYDHPSVVVAATNASVNEMTLQRPMMLLPAFKRTMERSGRLLTGEPIVWVYVALEEGVDYTYPGMGGFPADYDPRDRPWYTAAKASTGGAIWVKPYSDALGLGRMLTCSAPIYDDGNNFLGVAGLDLREDFVINEILKIKNQSYVAFLVDGQGEVLLQNVPGNLPEMVVKEIVVGREGRIWSNDKLVAYFQLGVKDWYYVLMAGSDRIQEVLESM